MVFWSTTSLLRSHCRITDRWITIDVDETESPAIDWDSVVSFMVHGRRPRRGQLGGWIRRTWNPSGSFEILDIDKVYGALIQLLSVSEAKRVMNHPVWFYDGYLVYLRQWKLGTVFDVISLDIIPAWISLSVARFYWDEPAILKVANAFGPMVEYDKMSTFIEQDGDARVCVLINTTKEISKEVWISHKGKEAKLNFHFLVLPPKCEGCRMFGHRQTECGLRKGKKASRKPLVDILLTGKSYRGLMTSSKFAKG